ncbi:MAG TPA: serine hydrolase [Lentimicrobium sp.]|nr:serine hydrolase [Lentimicrobium sp.]
MKFKILPIALLLLLLAFRSNCQNLQTLERLDSIFNKSLHDWNVPGMAIAIVKKDTILLSKGYGVKEVNKKDAVDANTLFAVASNTKAFTASAIGLLVDQGKLNWDDKVVDHIPWFRLYDPYVTANMTIRDLLSHRSGLTTFSGDLVWHGTSYSDEEVVRRARYLKPAYGFRTTFGYSNIMYLAAGLIIEKVSGKSWRDFIKDNFLLPLGMKSTLTSVKEIAPSTNLAMPHATDNDKTVKIEYLNWDNMTAAGGLLSSSNEMSKWIQLQLNLGKLGDKQLISEKSLNEMWYPQIMNPVSKTSKELWPQTHFKGYGMGWSLMDYYGKKVISHSGGYDGIISYTAFVPEANIGFVILTNKLSSLYLPMIYTILDSFLTPEGTILIDWNTYFLEREKKFKETEADAQKEKEKHRASNTKPSADLNKYVGTYKSELYGEAIVGLKEGELYLQFIPTPLYHGKLNHWQYDTFTVKFPDDPTLPEGTVNFVLNAEGNVEQMRIDIPNPDFDFTELDFRK